MRSAEMLARLVAFDTTSAVSNLELIGYVRDYLASHGIAARLIPDKTGRKANLFASIGPEREGGIALSGHTDVVPVTGQAWSSDPFVATHRDGRIYGRGTCDMKAFIAVALALVPRFKAMTLQRPLHFCFSYDEEVGCFGVPDLLKLIGREVPMPALAIVGEPTMMKVVNAHKGVQAMRTTIVGREAHSSAPDRGANAIVYMGRLIGRLEKLAADLRAEGSRSAMPGLDFDPPYTTVGIGRIDGGTAINIIARQCTLDWEFRPLPGTDVTAIRAAIDAWIETELLPDLRRGAPDGRVTTEMLAAVPALRPDAGLAESLALRLTGANRTEAVSFASEAGLFRETGISTVLCGPGSITQAHQPDEFVAEEQLIACERFLLSLADWAST